MMIVFFVAVVLLLIFIIKRLNRMKKKYDVHKIPGPPGVPILGNLLDIMMDKDIIHATLRKWRKQYGNIYKLTIFGFFHSIELSNPDDIETILSTPVHLKKSFVYTFLKPWLGDGLLLTTGTKWHERRKLLTPTFHFNILREFVGILEENSKILVNILEREVNKDKTDIIPLISGYTLNSICETAMGTKLDDNHMGQKYKEAILEMGIYFVQRVTKLWYHFNMVFNLSYYAMKQRRTLKTIRKFTNKVINERRQYIKTYGSEMDKQTFEEHQDLPLTSRRRMALLDLLLTAEKDNKIDEKGIQEEVDTFMFEGHDTTAVALNFTLMALANYKPIQDKIVDELYEIFGNTDRIATMEDLNRMKYLECCIKESLRLYPSVHLIGRQFEKKITLSNYVIPARSMCQIHIFDLHRRADLYPDPLVFNPDRFLPENSVGRHPYAYIPFSAGPRNCIGQKFAILEMKSAIAAILRKLELRPVTEPNDLHFVGDIVLRTSHPIYLSFVKRN